MKMLKPSAGLRIRKASAKMPAIGQIEYGKRKQLYGSARWDEERKAFLQINPFCVHCLDEGRRRHATVVDHIAGHDGDWGAKFWDQDNWQALCRNCHAVKTGSEVADRVYGPRRGAGEPPAGGEG